MTRPGPQPGPKTALGRRRRTGLFVMGPERAIALAEKLPDVEAMIVDAQGVLHTTSGFQLESEPPPATE